MEIMKKNKIMVEKVQKYIWIILMIYIYIRFVISYPNSKKTGNNNKKRANVAVIKAIRAKK